MHADVSVKVSNYILSCNFGIFMWIIENHLNIFYCIDWIAYWNVPNDMWTNYIQTILIRINSARSEISISYKEILL